MQHSVTPHLLEPDLWPVCFGPLASRGAYTPVLAKHSKPFALDDHLVISVGRTQRDFGSLKQQVG